MCRCCQSCWEDFYWNCIEEKFCYDENIALYDPDEDEYNRKKSNGFMVAQNNDGNLVPSSNNNNMSTPICTQPSRLQRHCSTISTKIHEDDFHREIQTTVPILAPEIISVFATSQIFHDHHEHKNGKSPSTVKFTTGALPSVHTPKSSSRKALEVDADKLLARLEDNSPSNSLNRKQKKIFTITEEPDFDSQQSLNTRSNSDLSEKLTFNKVHDEPIILRNKNLSRVDSEPNYMKLRPSSENDIFIISKSLQFSMTPEIPSISYSTLPKNYADTPTIEKYRESTSLYSIQTANINKSMEYDYTMPRFFGKSDLFAHNSLDNVNITTNINQHHINNEKKKTIEKSKRLKMFRNSLPPLMIHSTSLKEKPFRDGHNSRH